MDNSIPPSQYDGNVEMERSWRVLTQAVEHVVKMEDPP